jgi:hypothetical protein
VDHSIARNHNARYNVFVDATNLVSSSHKHAGGTFPALRTAQRSHHRDIYVKSGFRAGRGMLDCSRDLSSSEGQGRNDMVRELRLVEESASSVSQHVGCVGDGINLENSGLKLPRRTDTLVSENCTAAGDFVVAAIPAGVFDGVNARAFDHFCNSGWNPVLVAVIAGGEGALVVVALEFAAAVFFGDSRGDLAAHVTLAGVKACETIFIIGLQESDQRCGLVQQCTLVSVEGLELVLKWEVAMDHQLWVVRVNYFDGTIRAGRISLLVGTGILNFVSSGMVDVDWAVYCRQ